jgi:transposase
MKKGITVVAASTGRLQAQGQTIGLDLGDRSSCYCVLDKDGGIVAEQKVATTPKTMRDRFADMPGCRIALETGTYFPWLSPC